MKRDEFMPDVVDFAYQIVDMDREIHRLQAENADLLEYRQKYIDLLHSSTENSQETISGILGIVLTPGISEAIEAAANRGPRQ